MLAVYARRARRQRPGDSHDDHESDGAAAPPVPPPRTRDQRWAPLHVMPDKCRAPEGGAGSPGPWAVNGTTRADLLDWLLEVVVRRQSPARDDGHQLPTFFAAFGQHLGLVPPAQGSGRRPGSSKPRSVASVRRCSPIWSWRAFLASGAVGQAPAR